jgi:hypothetical protein
MRILPPYSQPEGHEPGFVELNQEEGLLEITGPADCTLMEESKIHAETLILRCRLHPIPLLNKAITVRLISEGESLTEELLYNEDTVSPGYEGDVANSQWKGIALEYVGVGRGIHQEKEFVFHGNTLPTGQIADKNPLYIKPFQVETQSCTLRTTTLATGHTLTSPPGVLNTRMLRGYGGYYQPGCPLADIGQVYYSLTSSYTQTRVRLHTTSDLQAQRTPPPHGGQEFNHKLVFNPHLREEEYLSLTGALAAGYARLSVLTEGSVVSYASYLCEPIPGHPTFVEVYFKVVSN